MKLEKRKPSGKEKDEGSVRLLEQLREKLYSEQISTARRTAFHLSWLQEDGFEILKEALFGDSSKTTKTATAYGLRSMRGRMKKTAIELLQKGVKHKNRNTRDACKNSLSLMGLGISGKKVTKKKSPRTRLKIREIPGKTRRGQRSYKRKPTSSAK